MTEYILNTLRNPQSRCAKSPVILFSDPMHTDKAMEYIDNGVSTVISRETAQDEIKKTIMGMFDIAPRFSQQLPIHLHVSIEGQQRILLCQTENISTTGILIRTSKQLPLRARVLFELKISAEGKPVKGVAEVVRQTLIGAKRLNGVALKFITFLEGSKKQFDSYMAMSSRS